MRSDVNGLEGGWVPGLDRRWVLQREWMPYLPPPPGATANSVHSISVTRDRVPNLSTGYLLFSPEFQYSCLIGCVLSKLYKGFQFNRKFRKLPQKNPLAILNTTTRCQVKALLNIKAMRQNVVIFRRILASYPWITTDLMVFLMRKFLIKLKISNIPANFFSWQYIFRQKTSPRSFISPPSGLEGPSRFGLLLQGKCTNQKKLS